MIISKIIFIGLPGSGKSSAAAQLAEKNNFQLCSSDAEIKNILNAYKNQKLDMRSIYYKKITELKAQFIDKGFDSEKVEDAFLSINHPKHSLAFMNILDESCWRETEAAITALLINEHPDYLFDLGASQVLKDSVRKAIEDNEFYLIYLNADEEAIEKHLLTPQVDGNPRYKSISNYAKAGDNWLELTKTHRNERAPEYAKIANKEIIVHKDTTLDEILEKVEELVDYMTPRYGM